MEVKTLTKAEEEIMHILWKIKKGFVKELLDYFDEPKPAYNTVSTIVRILEKKGFVGYTAFGKTHEYFPLISKEHYTRFYLRSMISGYFDGSFSSLVSFFAQQETLSVKEIEALEKKLAELKKKKS
jgi:BlaI family penicillinase repressor